MKKIFVVATRQNDGKTMVSLGLFNALKKRFSNMGYMKPVGQQYKVIDGKKIDKDAALVRDIYKLTDSFQAMSPIAVSQGFTEDYIENEKLEYLTQKLKEAYNEIAKNKDCLLIEGTGHAGVGSVFDLSNANVAKLFDAKVLLVSLGGIGRSIDEIMLNKAVFDQMGVSLMGVVINKVKQDKYDKIDHFIRKGLQRQGIKVWGVIPFVDQLIKPNIAGLIEALDATVLTGSEGLNNHVHRFIIGDMMPHEMMEKNLSNALFIAPASRDGLVMTLLCRKLTQPDFALSGIIFTSGTMPPDAMLSLIQSTKTPILLVKQDSFSIATKINNMLVKVREEETEKIKQMQHLVETYVDIDGLCQMM